jgi:tetratricopeptide (TPR) repeat protein
MSESPFEYSKVPSNGPLRELVQPAKEDYAFYIEFFESIQKREPMFVEVLENLGLLYTKNKDYDKGLKIDRKVVRLKPDDEGAHYNLACSLALKKRYTEALRSLQRAVQLGYSDWKWMQKDPDLVELRKRPAYKEWYATIGVREG